MKFFWKGTDSLGEKSKFFDKEGEFSLVSIEKFARYSDKITEVDEFFGELIGGKF